MTPLQCRQDHALLPIYLPGRNTRENFCAWPSPHCVTLHVSHHRKQHPFKCICVFAVAHPPKHTHTHIIPHYLFLLPPPPTEAKNRCYSLGPAIQLTALHFSKSAHLSPFHGLAFLLLSHCAKAQITDTDEQITGLKSSGSRMRRTQRWWVAANRSLKVLDATLFSLLLFNSSLRSGSHFRAAVPMTPRQRHPSWAALTISNHL